MNLRIFHSIFKSILGHKIIATLSLAIIFVGGYFGYQGLTKNESMTRYVTAAVEKGTLIVSVSGSGQVSAANQINITPKVSGELTALYLAKDQTVKTGQLLAVLDQDGAQKSVRDAQNALDDAEYSLAQAQKDYKDIEKEVNSTLINAYEDGYDAVSTAFFKLSGYMDDLKDVLGTEISSQEHITGYELILGKNSSFTQTLIDDYDEASDAFYENFAFFRTIYREDEKSTIYQLIIKTLETTKSVSQALDSARHMFDTISLYDYSNIRTTASQIDTMQPKIQSDVSAISSNISSLQTVEDTIDTTNEDTPGKIEDAQRAIQTAQNAVTKKQEALADAQKELIKYSVYTPFSGIIASVGDAQKGDTVSSNTVLATLITKAKIAEITLNEVDAAKVKVGQKATIIFDALEDLTVTGQVLEVDTIGTTNQGVVDYGAKISLDTTDERIKPGMTLSVEIITAAKQDVIMVSTTAIKKQGDSYYVSIANDDIKNVIASVATALTLADIKSQTVEIGLANDTMTEIISGLTKDDIVVTTTKSTTSSKSSSNSTSNVQAGPSGMEIQMMQIMR